ncbi:NmrA-like family domain-containing protein 1 [Colletotrichum sidae]|uniref:NmrA-like family domain-containing protein 1 n=1 Tax=Colletotrichum sidae TaxID=1347389 RepID=A0A4R8THR6_9PEZI|nr:NmrA-like family domain-containing protein 1 [Colletotrichum sidae]
MSVITKKTLVVIGATGSQGGSVVRTFLSDENLSAEWHVKGLTRNASSAAALELSKLGAEIVTGSLDSVSDLKTAFQNATAIFAVTDFWSAIADPATAVAAQAQGKRLPVVAQEIEEQWGRNLASAAADIPKLERFVFSSLPPVSELSKGKLVHVHHFDGKANIVKHIQKTNPALWSKTSQILIGHYNTNLLQGSPLAPFYNPEKKQAEFFGPTGPDAPMPFIDAAFSTGPFVKALIIDEPAGTVLAAFDEWQSRRETTDFLSSLTGKKFAWVQKSAEELAAASPLGLEWPESHLFVDEYGYFGQKVEGWKDTLTWPSDLKNQVRVRSVEGWLKEQDWSSFFIEA